MLSAEDKARIRAVLNGDSKVRGKNTELDLSTAFLWHQSEEGFPYWSKVWNRGYLTEQDKVRLMMMLGE